MSITPLMPVYPRCGVRPVRGEHCHLISEDGTRYLDFASGIAVNLLGHSHEHLIGAIQKQAATLMQLQLLFGILVGIAAKFGTTPKAISNLNGISDPSSLKIGQVLKIP